MNIKQIKIVIELTEKCYESNSDDNKLELYIVDMIRILLRDRVTCYGKPQPTVRWVSTRDKENEGIS